MVTQRIANPCTPVRFRYSPPLRFLRKDDALYCLRRCQGEIDEVEGRMKTRSIILVFHGMGRSYAKFNDSALECPRRLPEFKFLDFPRSRLGQFAKDHFFGGHEPRKMRAAETDDLCLCRVMAGF